MTVITPEMAASLAIPVPTLIAAEEFVERYSEQNVELVEGVVLELPMADSVHGFLCVELAYLFKKYCDERNFGRVCGNDALIRVRRDPDSVRGPDIAVYSHSRLPEGKLPRGLLDVLPELVIEVKSPHNRWNDLYGKVSEFLGAGIQIVLIIDPDTQTATIYRGESIYETLHMQDTLTLPDLLPGFEVPLAKLFG